MSADQAQTVETTAPAASAPAAVAPSAPSASAPSASAPETPLSQLNAALPGLIAKAGHTEMWGVELSNLDHIPTKVVLQKFLRANNGDPKAAEQQLLNALEWRKKMQPASLINQKFDKKKFQDLGFVTIHKDDKGKETVVTWNIYGAVKDNKATFGDVDEFIRWRAAIMELSVQKLNLAAITEPIGGDGADPYQMIQVHDYQNVSFWRMDPAVKAASKKTIEVFSMAYPELLAHKYFVNVPALMGWMFTAMKLFLAPSTLKKFHPMTSGAALAAELKGISSSLPKEYGGQGSSVKEGLSISLAETADVTKEEPKAVETETKPAVTETEKPIEESKPIELTLPIREQKPIEEAKPMSSEPEVAPTASEVAKPAVETSEAAPASTTAPDAADIEKKAVA